MPKYRFEFETFDTGCLACPFAVKLMNKDKEVLPPKFRCTVKHKDIPIIDTEAPDWCPLERIDGVE